MNTFKNTQYTITTSLSEQSSSIYIQIANNISYATYEGTFEKSAFRLSFELAGIYRIINKCFAAFTEGGESSYKVAIEIEPNKMRLQFHCMLEGIIAVEFEIRLQEKTVTPDSIMSAEFEKQKQLVETLRGQIEKQATELAELKKENETREWFETNFRNSYNQLAKMLETQQLDMCAELSKLTKKVKDLEASEQKLINEFDEGAYKTSVMVDALSQSHICFWSGERQKQFEISYPVGIRKLEINYAYGTMCNIIGKESYAKIQFFYQLEILELHCVSFNILFQMVNISLETLIMYDCSCNGCDMSFVKNFPNLKEIYVCNGDLNNSGNCIGESLSKITHKIKKLTFTRLTLCHIDVLQKYCKQNCIELYLH